MAEDGIESITDSMELSLSKLWNQSGGAPALRPGALAQSPGREAALAWASLAQRFVWAAKQPLGNAALGA